jgi:hypothetical protein
MNMLTPKSRVGDVIDAFMAIMVLRTCEQVEGGLPANVKSKMMMNIVLDFGIGLIPFLGDIADGKPHKPYCSHTSNPPCIPMQGNKYKSLH